MLPLVWNTGTTCLQRKRRKETLTTHSQIAQRKTTALSTCALTHAHALAMRYVRDWVPRELFDDGRKPFQAHLGGSLQIWLVPYFYIHLLPAMVPDRG